MLRSILRLAAVLRRVRLRRAQRDLERAQDYREMLADANKRHGVYAGRVRDAEAVVRQFAARVSRLQGDLAPDSTDRR